MGWPGFPEPGNFALPRRFLAAGITDMVRISSGRMSGTACGTAVLHVAPEAAVGGPLAAVRTGDTITPDVPARRLHLEAPDEEIARRLAAFVPPPPAMPGGCGRLWCKRVFHADRGAAFDSLVGCRGTPPPEDPY